MWIGSNNIRIMDDASVTLLVKKFGLVPNMGHRSSILFIKKFQFKR